MYQFVDEDCIVHRPAHKVTISLKNFQDETGSPKELFLLQKSLNGDSGDNISGIPEVGETSINRLIECMEDKKIESSKSFNGMEVAFVQACTEMQSRDKRNAKRYKAMLASMELIRRNWDLVDISLERFRDEEIEVIKVVVDEPMKFQEMEVVRAFGDLEFASLLEKWSWFAGPFRRFK
jgi:5'-3' exonuclease